MVQGLDSHLTCSGIVTPSICTWISSLIVSKAQVPVPRNLISGMVWIFSLSHYSFPSTLITPLSTDLAAVLIGSQNRGAISAVAQWCVIAVIVLQAFLYAIMIQACTGACYWNNALLPADAISSSIVLGRGLPLDVLKISRLSAMLEPDLKAMPWPIVSAGVIVFEGFFRFLGGTVTHLLGSVG